MTKKNKSNKKLIIIVAISTIFIITAVVATFLIIKSNTSKLVNYPNTPGLNVIVTEWSGWDGGSSVDRHYNFKPSKGLDLNFSSHFLDTEDKIFISEITATDITISLPNGVVAANKNGTINLRASPSPNNLVVQKNGDKSKACTQTMDAGTCFKFYYVQ